MDLYEEAVATEYLTLIQALKCLPGVMPNKSKKIMSPDYSGVEYSRYKIGKTELTEADYNEIWIKKLSSYGETIRISPKGARILLKLYYNGDLILKKGEKISKETGLQEYIDKEKYFAQKAEQLRRDDEYKAYLLENPEKIKESDFSYGLLDKLFWKKFGAIRGAESLVLDGIEVTKCVSVYKSNSGKSQDSEVVFSWVDSNGKKHVIKKPSSFKENRRNDPDRDWGLPD